MLKIYILLLCVALLGSGVVHAANGDGMTAEGVRTQREFCEAHPACLLAFKYLDATFGTKDFLSRLKPKGKELTDEEVMDALEESSGAPRSAVHQCIVSRNMGKCKALLGIGPDPDAEEAQKKADALAERLNAMFAGTRSERSGNEMSKSALKTCESATREGSTTPFEQASRMCDTAKKAIAFCMREKGRYDEVRDELQRIIDSGGVTNGIYTKLANRPFPECPATLPESGKTIETALSDHQRATAPKDKDKGAISAEEARERLDPCTAAKYDPDHAADYAAACKRKKEAEQQAEEDEAPVALSRSDSRGGSSIIRQAVEGEGARIEREQREKAARERVEREQAERERVESAESARRFNALITGVGAVVSVAADVELRKQQAQEQNRQKQQQEQRAQGAGCIAHTNGHKSWLECPGDSKEQERQRNCDNITIGCTAQ